MNTDAARVRRNLEAEKEVLMQPQPCPNPQRLREIITELGQLDRGEHWTQPERETLGRIVIADIRAAHKRKSSGACP